MGKFKDYINNRVLFKMAHLNNITIITRIISGILTSKAIAVFIGVDGMALIGNMRSFLSVLHSFSILGFYKETVKSISDFKDDAFKLSQTLSTALYLGFFSTLLIAFLSYYNAEAINHFLFSYEYNFVYIIEIMALALPFYSLNMFSFSIMNGFSKYKILLIINIIGQVLGFSITLLLIYQSNIDGALIAAVIAPSLIIFVTFVGFFNQGNFSKLVKITNVNFGVLKRFTPFGVVALVTAIAIPFVSILIRNYIIAEVGLKQAGHWEAMQRISDYYLMFINSLIVLYCLPRFTEIVSKREFRKELFDFYKSVMPFFGIGLVIIYLLRSLVVSLILSDAFEPTTNLFLWQLLGDFFKVLSIVIVYQFIAKRMFGHILIVQIFLGVVTYLSSIYLIDIFGVRGAVIGHFVSYFMYFGIILLIYGKSLFGTISENSDNE